MNRTVTTRRGRCAMLAACAMPFIVERSLGGVSYDSADSSVKITHYAERDNPGAFGSKNVVPPPASGSMPIPGSYQYSKTLNLNGGSSSASATIGAVTNSQNVGFTFASGTGITQSDPTGTSFSKAAQLKFVVDGEWDVSAGGFGPTAYGYLAFTLGGVIPAGDSASVDINLSWQDAGNNNLRAPISQTISFPSSTLPYAYSNAAKLNTGSVTGGEIHVTGTITFNALDPGATIDLHPTDFEMSAAPPTFQFQSKNGVMSDSSNWTIDQAMAQGLQQPTFPDEPGVRAYVGPAQSGQPNVTDLTIQDVPTTLGVLDVDRPGVTLSGSAPLTFNTLANNAVLFLRDTHNFGPAAAAVTVQTPVVLDVPLEVVVDDAPGCYMNGPISDVGGLIKSGLGNLYLNASNTFTGGITVNSGTLTPTADGALGSNTVTLNGGMINIMTQNPFADGGGTITVNSAAQINIGTDGIVGTNYNVATFGAISGSAAQLQSLVIGSNYFPKPNSMIAHQTFDTGVNSGNPVGLTNTPTYLFGIATDFPSGQFLVAGLGSVSPWSGFGGDTQSHTIGSSTTATSPAITAAGVTQFVSLGGQLVINEQIKGLNNPSIIKNGPGLVAFNSVANTFTGPTEVQSGPMAINGTWNGPITVDPGAALGGTGNVATSVNFINSPTNPAFFKPGLLGNVANGPTSDSNTTIEGPGTLHTGAITFGSTTHLVYDLDTPGVAGGADNDLLVVNGDLTLNGILDINGGQDFTGGIYTLMTYTGNLIATGTYPSGLLALGNVDLESFPNAFVFNVSNMSSSDGLGAGGTIYIAVPEPTSAALLAGLMSLLTTRRTRRTRLAT